MVRFKYNMKPELKSLVESSIANYFDDFLYGMMDEALVSKLRHCSLFLVCPDNNIDGKQFNENPVVIVAESMTEACTYYEEEFHKYGFVVAELENRCDGLKVEAI